MSGPVRAVDDWRSVDTVTVEEWAEIMRISRTIAYREVKAKRVPSIRVGGVIRIPTQWVRQQVDADQQEAAE